MRLFTRSDLRLFALPVLFSVFLGVTAASAAFAEGTGERHRDLHNREMPLLEAFAVEMEVSVQHYREQNPSASVEESVEFYLSQMRDVLKQFEPDPRDAVYQIQ